MMAFRIRSFILPSEIKTFLCLHDNFMNEFQPIHEIIASGQFVSIKQPNHQHRYHSPASAQSRLVFR